MTLPTVSPTTSVSLIGLLVLAVVMFVAMLVGTPPHPPADRGPYLGSVIALSVMSLWLLRADPRRGLWLALLTFLAFVPAVGPHKFWTEPAAQALAPLIALGTGLLGVGIVSVMGALWHAPSRGGSSDGQARSAA